MGSFPDTYNDLPSPITVITVGPPEPIGKSLVQGNSARERLEP